MSKFVAEVFKLIGIFLVIIAFLFLVFGLVESGLTFGAFCFTLFSGAFLFYLGQSMLKLSRMEDKLGRYILTPTDKSNPLLKCEKCNKRYDPEDAEQCPYCELKRLQILYKYR